VDFDLTLTVLADLLYRNLADRLKGFAQAGPSTLFRKFVDTPGVIEITAQGSDDVSQIGLSDGLGRMQLFTHDPASSVWHVLYRVPVGTTKDRLALSVTALNDVNRWRRVWVFVNVRQTASSSAVETDGCGGAEE
jgi:hypothetical protein